VKKIIRDIRGYLGEGIYRTDRLDDDVDVNDVPRSMFAAYALIKSVGIGQSLPELPDDAPEGAISARRNSDNEIEYVIPCPHCQRLPKDKPAVHIVHVLHGRGASRRPCGACLEKPPPRQVRPPKSGPGAKWPAEPPKLPTVQARLERVIAGGVDRTHVASPDPDTFRREYQGQFVTDGGANEKTFSVVVDGRTRVFPAITHKPGG
jgi:hypothetical protein